jgi:hypothetical protein
MHIYNSRFSSFAQPQQSKCLLLFNSMQQCNKRVPFFQDFRWNWVVNRVVPIAQACGLSDEDTQEIGQILIALLAITNL